MSEHFDVARYFDRIGYDGMPRADFETLARLTRLHPEAIPFENLDPLTGRRVKLDPESLRQKLLGAGRGGYCFEHNGLLQLVLTTLGFRVTPLAARVLWSAPEGAPLLPRTHSLSLVELGDERYIVDVGFGALTPTAPLRLQPDVEQPTPHESMRLLHESGVYTLQASTEGTWRSMYRFDLQPQLPSDYAMANWYVSTLPESHFVTRLGVARVAPGRRHTLRGAELATHDMHAGTTRRRIESIDELRVILTELFAIRLPNGRELDAALERTIDAAAVP
jgi:N-hydroxyarylamine O-acetyltransferase